MPSEELFQQTNMQKGSTTGSYAKNTYQMTGTGNTYQIWVDGSLFMEWSDFQWSPVTPRINQWRFDQPITVTEQIVFRVINTNVATKTDTIEVCFGGWSEQYTGYTDVSYQQLVPTNN